MTKQIKISTVTYEMGKEIEKKKRVKLEKFLEDYVKSVYEKL